MTDCSAPHSGRNKLIKLLSDESLGVFIEGMKEFDQAFCDLMASGTDFTLRLEVRGNTHKLLHCRTYQESIRRPREAGGNRKTA